MIIASRVLLLSRLGKEHPELPAELAYSAEELAVLAVKRKETGKYSGTESLTMLQANVLTAMMVGFWGRECDGHPGSQVLAEGVWALQLVMWYERQCNPGGTKRSRQRSPT